MKHPRKFLLTLLLTALLASPAMAAKTTDIKDPNHPAFSKMKKDAENFDKTEITLPMGGKMHTNFLAQAMGDQSNLRAGGCNPVVMARMMQVGTAAVLRETAKTVAISKTINPRDFRCAEQINRVAALNDFKNDVDDAALQWLSNLTGFSLDKIKKAAGYVDFKASSQLNGATALIDNACDTMDKRLDGMYADISNGSLMTYASNHGVNPDLNKALTIKLTQKSGATPPAANGNGNGGGQNAVALPVTRQQVPQAAAPAAAPQQQANPNSSTPAAPARNIYQ